MDVDGVLADALIDAAVRVAVGAVPSRPLLVVDRDEADPAANRAYLTTIVPFMPACSCPGTEQNI